MTPTDRWEGRLACPRCGGLYVSPPREGAYRCAACGCTLPASRSSSIARAWNGDGRLLALIVLLLMLAGAWAVRESRLRTWGAFARRPAGEGKSLVEVTLDQIAAERERQQAALNRSSNPGFHHIVAANWIYRDVIATAPARLRPSPAPLRTSVSAADIRQRQIQTRELERYVAAHFKARLAPALEHAETAVRLARSAFEEIQARQTRAEGRLLSGQYRQAMADFRWLEEALPGSSAAEYARCYQHLGRAVPRRLQTWLSRPVGVRQARRTSRQRVRQALAGIERLAQRWPKDGALQQRAAVLCFGLASLRAADQPGFPSQSPDLQAGADAFTNRHFPALIQRGLAHCGRALALAKGRPEQAQALESLARGLLLTGRSRQAIEAARRAMALAPPGSPNARLYLRSALVRLNRLPA